MANELTISVSLSYRKGSDSFGFAPGQKQITVTGTKHVEAVQALSTSTEALAVGEVSTAGYAYFQNLDSTNYIEVSTDNANANKVCKLFPGEFALLRPGSTTLYATAGASTPLLKFGYFEN